MFDKFNNISDEMLAAYLDGNTTPEENILIEIAIKSDENLMEVLEISSDLENGILMNDEIFTRILDAQSEDVNNSFDLHDIFHQHIGSNIENDINMQRDIKYANGHIGEDAKIDVSSDVFQWYEDTCAIRSQQLVLEKYGVFVSQEELINVATNNGWYNAQGGTPLNCVGNLLDYYGVPSTSIVGANVHNIVTELAQGHQVIVGVDSGELHNNTIFETLKDLFVGHTPDHALIVAGIDTTNPGDEYVILKDPGTGDVAKPYPLDKFLDAWKDANCFMVTTHDPAYPQYSPELVNFDYQAMHIDNITDLSFDDFIAENSVIMPDDMIVIDPIIIDQWMHDSFDNNMSDSTFQTED